MSALTPERKIELLTAFNANEDMKQAVKEELLKGIYQNGVIVEGQKHNALENWALSLVYGADGASNELIGSKLVAIAEGIRFLQSSFSDIEKNYKPTVTGNNKSNPAR